jgi:hypothetical protein
MNISIAPPFFSLANFFLLMSLVSAPPSFTYVTSLSLVNSFLLLSLFSFPPTYVLLNENFFLCVLHDPALLLFPSF